jgi:predicted NBD/HSP70 family sugar kinase
MRMPDPQFNRLTVLKKLRAAQPVSRTDLAQISGLTGGSITAIVGDLVARGLVLEERLSAAGRGRPKVNLRINPDGAFVAGATLTMHGDVAVEIVNLSGESIFAYAAAVRQTSNLADLASQFVDCLNAAIAGSPIERNRISQIGIGLPAIVDNQRGIVKFLATFDPDPCPFAAIVEGEMGIPTRIDNNINLLARAEHWFGDGAGVDDFTLVLLDLGLGAATYQAGQLVIGSHGTEAELGHTKIVPADGRACHCGAFGCLETYSSISGIVGQFCDLSGQNPPSHFEIRGVLGELINRAQAGADDLREIFQRAGSYFGIGIANYINMLDPDRIIILAREPGVMDMISDPFFSALHDNTLPALRNLARVTFKQLDEQSYARGAAAMVLEQLYQSR